MSVNSSMPSMFQQALSFFDLNTPTQHIMDFQTNVSSPSILGLETGTDGIIPDVVSADRLSHFPEDQYDLAPTSHLMRFLQSLLGDSGVGQLRKRTTLARFSTSINSTHFFDLDRFYGAIFGCKRRPNEQFAINPLTETATQEEWDEIAALDGLFRERIIQLAKCIPLGGTVLGVQAAAEALTGVPCDVYEVWAIVDDLIGMYGDPSFVSKSWDAVIGEEILWAELETLPWEQIMGGFSTNRVSLSRTSTPTAINRSEFIVRPKKQWANDQDKAVEEFDLIRVIDKIKPAGSLLTIDNKGIGLHKPAVIAGVRSDSNYWEVTPTVAPRADKLATSIKALPVYPVSVQQEIKGITPLDPHPLPAPAFVRYQGEQINYNSEIVTVTAYAHVGESLYTNINYELSSYPDGTVISHTPDKGVMDGQQVAAAKLSTDGQLVAAPYSADRTPIVNHD